MKEKTAHSWLTEEVNGREMVAVWTVSLTAHCALDESIAAKLAHVLVRSGLLGMSNERYHFRIESNVHTLKAIHHITLHVRQSDRVSGERSGLATVQELS